MLTATQIFAERPAEGFAQEVVLSSRGIQRFSGSQNSSLHPAIHYL
jgi:hypothetical protein